MNEMALQTNKCKQHECWRDIGSYHSNHPEGGYKNDIDVTIKCHQRLGKEAIYIYIYIYMTLNSKKGYNHTTDFTLIAQTELLVIQF